MQLLDAQVDVLDSMVEMVKAESVDVVVVAGDIYDRPVPSGDAVNALDHALGELRATGARVVGISGNHDSAARIGFAEQILTAGGVTLRGDVRAAGKPVIVPEADGASAVAFYPIPYLEPETARHALGAPEARSHEKLLRLALDRARSDFATRSNMRSMAIVHAFVTGGQESESELALAVGGSAEVPLRSLRGFDYTALGHLHGRQSFGDGSARYSGSLMAYSFSERDHTKGAWLVDLAADGKMEVAPVDYPVHRKLFQVKGDLLHLLSSPAFSDAEGGYVHAIVTDAILPMEPMTQLRKRFPHVVHLVHEPPARQSNELTYADRVRGKNDLELSIEFFEEMADRPPTEQEREELVAAVIAPVKPASERAA